MKQPSRRIFGPFNRVEGDLEVQIEEHDGRVSRAWVNSPLYRGFEQMLVGKNPQDALVYTPRICGICSVSQSVAASRALADLQGVGYTDNGRLATNLILACENMADHLSHFYLFFMPDFAREVYQKEPWFETIHRRFAAQRGSASRDALPARSQFLQLTGLLAGRWPHSLALQPGGTTCAIDARERIKLITLLGSFRQFLQNTLFGAPLEQVAELHNSDALWAWAEQHPQSDFGQFLMLCKRLDLEQLGRANDRFLSYGAYETAPQTNLFQAGVWHSKPQPFDSKAISEDIKHSWMHAQRSPKHPYQGSTEPDADAANAYSWCKAPRYDGHVMEVGALARQLLDRQPMINGLVKESGGNVQNRVVARLLELARVLPEMERWAKNIRIDEAFIQQAKMPDEGEGYGLVEAARGSLGHWIRVKHGHIINYQIIAPTTWNFSPRDEKEQPGALEQALVGTPLSDDNRTSVAVQHVVRSFDPCMVCTVH
ncbi:MAG: nickel-dependent hydrogenase large subunit [Gammaproteobacteria bacterium]|nr:nickel-dependent hydrogenase large subunit [Gammaproteobacteria bacterium]